MRIEMSITWFVSVEQTIVFNALVGTVLVFFFTVLCFMLLVGCKLP